MKTDSLIKKAAGIVALLFLTMLPAAKAQVSIPYPVTNLSNCDVEISYQFYDSNCLPVCGVFGSGTVMLVPGQVDNLPGCAAAYDVDLVVNWVSNNTCPATQLPSPANTFCTPGSATAIVTNPCGSCNGAALTLLLTGASFQ